MTSRKSRFLLGALAAGALFWWGDGRAQEATDDDDSAQSDVDDDDDSEWPREIDATTATIVVYQPQLDDYADGVLEAHSAISITPTGSTEPVFGAVWFKAKTETDRDARVCNVLDVEVPNARFADSTPEAETKLAELIRQAVPGWVHPISMDRLLPALEALAKETAIDARLSNEPPRIVVETVPAMLVPIDGEAKLVAVPGTSIQRVVNSPVALLFDPATKTYWIDAGAAWICAPSVDGPYGAADAPASVAAVRTSNESSRTAAPTPDAGAVPKIVVAHEPTELVVFDGAPQWKALVGDELSYATNSAGAVFATKSEGRFYVLLSGRWFRSASPTAGPWEFVAPDKLPDCFEQIPEDSEMGGVLAHVAGTDLANEAILDAQIPQTKAIRRDAATCVVVYDGAPKFEAIPGTDIRYAVNTASQVLAYKDRYYCCDQGAWFASVSPTGPWTLADQVPSAFQQIPPECPCYNVKYVQVYDATPEIVYVGCTPGYLGWYPWNGVVVWGTGRRYSCWYGDAWYPRCSTWGVSVAYNPWSGSWYEGLSLRWGGGWSVGIGVSSGWGWGGSWWGPCGYRPWRRHDGEYRRPVPWSRGFDRSEPGLEHRHGPSLYESQRNRTRNAPDRATTRPQSRGPAERARPAAPPTRPARPRNDVFMDRDGKVYRRGGDGRWHQRVDRQWRPTPSTAPKSPTPRAPAPRARAPSPPRVQHHPPMRPAPTPQLGRDAWARDRGRVRTGGGAGGGGRRR